MSSKSRGGGGSGGGGGGGGESGSSGESSSSSSSAAAGDRAAKLRLVLRKALTSTVRPLKWHVFLEQFPVPESQHAAVQVVYQKLLDDYAAAVESEFDAIMRTTRLVDRLAELDRVIASATAPDLGFACPAPLDSTVDQLVDAAVAQERMRELQRLSAQLASLNDDNERLASQLRAQLRKRDKVLEMLEQEEDEVTNANRRVEHAVRSAHGAVDASLASARDMQT